MMKNPRAEKEDKDLRNLFRLEKLKKETTDITIKDIRNHIRPKIENKAIKDRILRYIFQIRNVFRLEKENKVIKDIILRGVGNLFENEEE